MDAAVPAPGVDLLLDSLVEQGKRLAIVTNNAEGPVRAFLGLHKMSGKFEAVCGRDPRDPRRMKPDPSAVRLALERLGHIAPEAAVKQIAVARGDGSYTRVLDRLAKLDVLAIDDWLLAPLRDTERRDLVEIIEDRSERASTIIASQLPLKDWHASIGDPNLADAICDRLVHNAHRLELRGRSKRGPEPDSKAAKR